MSKVDVRPMIDYLTDVTDTSQMRELIEEVLFEYAYSVIEKAESGNKRHVMQNIQLLRELRDVFANM